MSFSLVSSAQSLQYACKVLSLNLAESDPKNEWVGRFSNAAATINSGRKLGGLGQSLDFIQANRSINWANPREILKGLSNTCNIAFWFFDNIIFLQRAKLTTYFKEDDQVRHI